MSANDKRTHIAKPECPEGEAIDVYLNIIPPLTPQNAAKASAMHVSATVHAFVAHTRNGHIGHPAQMAGRTFGLHHCHW